MLRVTVPAEMRSRLRDALWRAGRNECGGVLMGEHVGHNHFVVRALTFERTGSFARFLRGVRVATSALRAFFKRTGNDYSRFNYLGEWHSHPSFPTEPSTTDHGSMMRIVQDPAVGANFAVLVIVRLDQHHNLQGSAHTYLPDGSVRRSQLDFLEYE